MTTSHLKSELNKIEQLLEENMGATGSCFRDKVLTATNQLPKGIVEKLNYLAGLLERVQAGGSLSSPELKQAGFYINAIYPYVTHGAPRRSGWVAKLVWLALTAAVLVVAYKYLH